MLQSLHDIQRIPILESIYGSIKIHITATNSYKASNKSLSNLACASVIMYYE